MRVAMTVILAAVVLVVAAVGAILTFAPAAYATGAVEVRVRAMIVDARTGEPVSGATLLTAPRADLLDDSNWMSTQRAWHTAGPDSFGHTYADVAYSAWGVSDASGHISTYCRPDWCWRVTPLDRFLRREPPVPERYAVEAYSVWRDGYERVSAHDAAGTWSSAAAPEGANVLRVLTCDLGTIRLVPQRQR